MCVVSMVGDYYSEKWKVSPPGYVGPLLIPNVATKQDLEELKKEVIDMKELLKKAIEYDKKNNQPHCETEEKIELMRKVAEMVGVDLNDVLGNKNEKNAD